MEDVQKSSTVFKTAGFTLKLFTFVHLFRGPLSQKATFTPKNPIVMQYSNYKIIQQHQSSFGSLYESSRSTRTLVSTFEINREGTSSFHSLFCAMSGLMSSISYVPSRFISNVETRVLVERDDSYRDPNEDWCCCIIL
jgi:hypothetical protein